CTFVAAHVAGAIFPDRQGGCHLLRECYRILQSRREMQQQRDRSKAPTMSGRPFSTGAGLRGTGGAARRARTALAGGFADLEPLKSRLRLVYMQVRARRAVSRLTTSC